MSFDSIAGQDKAKQMLKNGLEFRRISHAYIFHGPAGTGKRAAALTFAKVLFCLGRGSDPCGECVECRKAEHGNHPDLYRVVPENGTIKIDRIRELQQRFAYRSQSSRMRVYIIEEAERMTTQAANSLLKFLEEPNSNIVAVLLTENGQALLPTIRSRAQWIPFSPVPPRLMIASFVQEGFAEPLVRSAVHLAAGPAAAKALMETNWFAELRSIVIQLVQAWKARLQGALLLIQQKLAKTDLMDRLDMLMDLFMLWFKDMIHILANRKANVVFIDQLDWMGPYALSRPGARWVSCMEQAAETRKRLRFHVNPQLALEQFIVAVERG